MEYVDFYRHKIDENQLNTSIRELLLEIDGAEGGGAENTHQKQRKFHDFVGNIIGN